MTIARGHIADTALVNRLEITSIRALLAYTAHNQNVSESTLMEVVTARFGVDDVAKLTSRSYDQVIRFLVDVQIDLILN